MRVILLIQAHRDVEQLNRLIHAVADKQIAIYVHLDRRSKVDPAAIDGRAKLIKSRVDVFWGDFSQAQATLNSLAEIEADGDYDYVILISGQDYPVWPSEKIVRFLEGANRCEFLQNATLDKNGWASAADRFDYYYYSRNNPVLKVAYTGLRVLMRLLSLKRHLVGDLRAYGGSSWFILSRDCIRYILKYISAHPRFIDFMKSVFGPDESLFQTIVMNSPFRDRVINDNKRYIDWSDCEKGLSSSPTWLTERDFDKIIASGAMFCRKVDSVRSAKLMALLDAHRAA